MTLFGIEVLEPTTTITDFIVAGMGFFFGHMLFWVHSKNKSPLHTKYIRMWALAFLFTGLGALFGGISHGFVYLEEQIPFLKNMWPFTLMSIGLTSFYLLLTVIIEYFPQHKNKLFFAAYFKLLLFMLLLFGYPFEYFGQFPNVTFGLAIFDYTPVIVLILVLNLLEYVKTSNENFENMAAKTMAIGICVSIVASLIQMSKFSLHQHFNFNDIYHIILMGALYLMYRAVTLKKMP